MRTIAVCLVLGLAIVIPGAIRASTADDPGPLIVFESGRSGKGDIYAMSLTTMAVTQLTSNAKREDQPVWSRDGLQIAYRRGWDIWTMNADGTGQINRTPGTFSREDWPFWLPDGRLGFASDRSGVQALYLLQGETWLPLGRQGRKAAVSREGLSICYTRDVEVYRADLSGGPEVNVSNWEGSDHDCAWEPVDNPAHLLIHSHRSYLQAVGRLKTGRIWQVDLAGAVAPNPETEGSDKTSGDSHPTWHAAGWLAWVKHVDCIPGLRCGNRQRDKMGLFARSPEGVVIRLTDNTVEDGFPNFRP